MKVRTLAVTVSSFLTAVAILLVVDYIAKTILPEPVPVPVFPALCRRSVDRVFVADEKGRVCKWQDVNYETGCCPDDQSTDACQECKENCCSIYAYCISCCLQPANPMQHPNFSTPEPNPDKFEYCRVVCRTSSRSVINEKQWISELKYCFPTHDFPLLVKDLPSFVISKDASDEAEELADSLILGQGHTEFIYNTKDGLKLGMDKIGEKPELSTELVTVPEAKEKSKTDKGGLEGTLEEITTMQKTQEMLVEKLGEQMKTQEQLMQKLVEENEKLAEENKNLTDKLEEVNKGRLEEVRTQQQKEKEEEEKIEEKNGSCGRYWSGLVFLSTMGLCMGV